MVYNHKRKTTPIDYRVFILKGTEKGIIKRHVEELVKRYGKDSKFMWSKYNDTVMLVMEKYRHDSEYLKRLKEVYQIPKTPITKYSKHDLPIKTVDEIKDTHKCITYQMYKNLVTETGRPSIKVYIIDRVS